LQIYNDINTNNNNSKTISLYPKIFSKYEKAINSILEKYNLTDVIVEPYGSVVNNFLTKDGDIDISIIPKSISKDDFIKYLQKIEDKLVVEDKCAIQYSNIYINSRYALLSLVDIETNINIDITVHNLLPIYNTKMIRFYSLYDQRFHILGLFLKHWVKINNIKGAPNGFLSSYALLLLIIHFLQSVVEPKVLPILQEIKSINKEYKYYNGEKELTTNLYFEENIDDIKEYMNIINCGNENNMTTTELLVQFLEYYAYKYNMENHYLISIKQSNRIKAKNCEQIVFPIEDPFDVAHNPGKTLKYNSQQHSEFIFCMKKEINNILSGEYFKNYNY
jgi:DNA polymerase sigma